MLKNIKPNPCWILADPRSGSSFLCEILNKTMIFPFYDHPKIKTNDFFLKKDQGRAFDEWFRLFSNKIELYKSMPSYVKVIYDQLFFLDEKISIYDIEKIHPKIKFIYISRKSKIDQTVSLYIAKKLNAYHVFTKKFLNKCQSFDLDINHDEILNCYFEVKNFYDWKKFLKNKQYYHVYFESLIENPKVILKEILNYLNLPCVNFDQSIEKAKNTIFKIDHQKTNVIKEYLKKYVVE